MNIFIRLWARLTKGKLVWLEDHSRKCTLVIARETPFGDLVIVLHGPYLIQNGMVVKLLPDGTTDSSYVKRWKYETDSED